MNRKSLVRVTCFLLLLVVITSNVKLVKAITWSTNLIRFTTYTYYDGQPAITQMQDGKIWLVWSKEVIANRSLYYETSSNLGNTWSDEMNLTEVPCSGHNRNPSIIQAANGTIWVVWISDRPAPQPPPPPDFNLTASPPSLTIPQGGSDTSTITVTSLNNFSNTVRLSISGAPPDVTTTLDPIQVTPPANSTATSTLTVSVETTVTPGNYTLMMLGRSGKIVHFLVIPLEIIPIGGSGESALAHTYFSPSSFLSQDAADGDMIDYEIFCKTSHDNGATWSNDIQLTDNLADDLRPSIVQLANGTIMLVWQSNRLGNHDIFFMTSDGTSWSDAHQLTTDPNPDKGPHVTQTKDGKIWVIWASSRTGDYEIHYNTYDGSWSTDTMLTYSGSSSRSDVTPSILQTIDDTMWIFWTSSTSTGDSDVYYRYSSDNGASWSDPIQFTTNNNEDVWPTVTQTRDTKIWVVWTSNRGDQPDGNWDAYYKTSLAGDVNEDGAVDILDLSIVGMAYGKREGYPGYNVEADLNRDGIIDSRDLAIICYYYGAT